MNLHSHLSAFLLQNFSTHMVRYIPHRLNLFYFKCPGWCLQGSRGARIMFMYEYYNQGTITVTRKLNDCNFGENIFWILNSVSLKKFPKYRNVDRFRLNDLSFARLGFTSFLTIIIPSNCMNQSTQIFLQWETIFSKSFLTF